MAKSLSLAQADFLTTEQRQCWADYLNQQNIGETKFAFFSAIQEDEEDEEEEEEEEDKGEEGDIEEMEKEDTKAVEVKETKKEMVEEEVEVEEKEVETALGEFPDPCEILTSSRFLQLFRSFKRHESGTCGGGPVCVCALKSCWIFISAPEAAIVVPVYIFFGDTIFGFYKEGRT